MAAQLKQKHRELIEKYNIISMDQLAKANGHLLILEHSRTFKNSAAQDLGNTERASQLTRGRSEERRVGKECPV